MEEFIKQHIAEVDAIPNAFFVKHFHPAHFRKHKHKKHQFTFIEGGVAVIFANEQSYYIPPRHYAWIPKGLAHEISHRSPGVISRTIYIDTFDFEEDAFYQEVRIYPVNNLILEMIFYTETMEGNILKGTREFSFLSSLVQLLPKFAFVAMPLIIPSTHNERLIPILKYIQHHYDEDLTLESLAKKYGFSGKTLNRLMLGEMSITFFQYLKITRIVRSLELLLQGHKTINQIALAVGYASVSAYSNAFQLFTGKRPTEFLQIVSR